LTNQTRPIPKKTIVIISILIILGIVFYFVNEMGKSVKAAKVLNYIGYKGVSNVHVAAMTKFRNAQTSIEGFKYTVKFHNDETNQNCHGFIWADFKNNVIQDLDCE
jgi:hypothetical protein